MKTKFLVMTALVCTTVLATPSFAVPPPTQGEPGETPQEICDRLLQPNNPNSKFQTVPSNIGEPTEVPGSQVITSQILVSVTPVGDPVYSEFSGYDNFHRNGGSPNVWASATADSVVYPDGSLELYDILYDVDVATPFGCDVFKVNPNDNEVDPAGLESTGHTAIETLTDVAGQLEVAVPGPYIPPDSGSTFIENLLVCISPDATTRGKPGDWRGMHGFAAADCPAASIAAGGTVPSENNPD